MGLGGVKECGRCPAAPPPSPIFLHGRGLKMKIQSRNHRGCSSFSFQDFSKIFFYIFSRKKQPPPSDLQAAPNIPRLGYATPYLVSGCYADHIASV